MLNIISSAIVNTRASSVCIVHRQSSAYGRTAPPPAVITVVNKLGSKTHKTVRITSLSFFVLILTDDGTDVVLRYRRGHGPFTLLLALGEPLLKQRTGGDVGHRYR